MSGYSHSGRCPSRHRWQLEVVLPSSTLLLSRDNGSLKSTQKPVVRCSNSIANAIAPARCTVAGAAASRGRKTKAEVEAETAMTTLTRTTTWMARTIPASAISCCQGRFSNQQGREAAMEGSGVGADGSTMMQRWLQQTMTAGTAAVAQAAAISGLRLSSPPPPSQPLVMTVVRGAHRSPSCVARMPGKENNLIFFKQT